MSQSAGRVLVVDDDKDTRILVVDILEGDGHQVHACPTGEQALKILCEASFDLILSDIKMPGITGIELLRHVRKSGLNTTVILMTAYASVETAIQALRGEAFDYLIKPFSLPEFRQRVRHAIQAKTATRVRHTVEHYANLSIDHQARRVWVDEHEIALTRLEFDVLSHFFECLGRPVSIEELLDRVWEIDTPDDCSSDMVRSAVHRVRRKIEDDAREPRYIKNVWGVGYQLGP